MCIRDRLYCAPGNGGIAALAQCVPLSATDVDGVVAWAQAHSIDFVVVAPDDPLALGMVDALEDAGIPAFGPRADAAIIEASKIFSKNLMAKYHIPTAKYQTFTELAPAQAYIEAEEMCIRDRYNTFNMGIGLVIAIPKDQVGHALDVLARAGEQSYVIGDVIKGDAGVELV